MEQHVGKTGDDMRMIIYTTSLWKWYQFPALLRILKVTMKSVYITATYKMCDWEKNFCVEILKPRQNDRYFADDISEFIFWTENIWVSIEIWLKFVPEGPIYNIPVLVQIMVWRRPGK